MAKDKTICYQEKDKTNIIKRLRRIEGQIGGIARMIFADVTCDAVLNQITSADAALNGVKKQLIRVHIMNCLGEQIESDNYEVIDELIVILGRMTPSIDF